MADEYNFSYNPDAPKEKETEKVVTELAKEIKADAPVQNKDSSSKSTVSAFQKVKDFAKKTYHFLWVEESFISYAVFIVVAYLFLRFIFFPVGLFVTGYSDVAAVISGSMLHNGGLSEYNFNEWLRFYNVSNDTVASWPYQNGLNIGDVVVVKKVPASEIKVGDVILFYYGSKQIVHRVVDIKESSGESYYTTKGDANAASLAVEKNTPYSLVKGKVVSVIPFIGYPKYLVTLVFPFL